MILALAALGLAWDVHAPSPAEVAARQRQLARQAAAGGVPDRSERNDEERNNGVGDAPALERPRGPSGLARKTWAVADGDRPPADLAAHWRPFRGMGAGDGEERLNGHSSPVWLYPP